VILQEVLTQHSALRNESPSCEKTGKHVSTVMYFGKPAEQLPTSFKLSGTEEILLAKEALKPEEWGRGSISEVFHDFTIRPVANDKWGFPKNSSYLFGKLVSDIICVLGYEIT
jgi:hypothetical protein